MVFAGQLVSGWKGRDRVISPYNLTELSKNIASIINECMPDLAFYKIQTMLAFNQFGYPFPKGEKNKFLFIYCDYEELDISRYMQRSFSYDDWAKQTVEFTENTVGIRVHLYLYGEDSDKWVLELKSFWYSMYAKTKFDMFEIYTVPGKDTGPTKIMEQTNGQWFTRCDVSFLIYMPNYFSLYNDISYYDKYKIQVKEEKQ